MTSLQKKTVSFFIKLMPRKKKKQHNVYKALREKKSMATRKGGSRRKTRHKLRKSPRTKGKISIRSYLREFKVGANVSLSAESAVQKGMYMPRFHGRTAKVIGTQGDCYKVSIVDGSVKKTFIVHPVHLKGVQ